MKAVVLLSGGMDSTVVATAAAEQHRASEVMAVSFKYGQTHDIETAYAAKVSRELNLAEHRIISLPNIFAGTGSMIVAEDAVEMTEESYAEIEESYGVSPTYVPFRNANLISVATAVALAHEADEVWAGMHGEDALHWAYPDCTPEFLGAIACAIYVGTYHKVRLVTPLQWFTKAQVVEWGLKLGAPMDLTMSCYRGEDPACGTCPTCIGRINAWRAVGRADVIEYAIDIDWNGE